MSNSNKGKVFTEADLPRITQQRIKNKQVGKDEVAKIKAWLDAQTERNKIVAKMDDGTPLIAEELTERAMRQHAAAIGGEIDSRALSLLRMLVDSTQEQRAAVLAAFDKKGNLTLPFKKA
jgi:hypothetical protein